VVMMLKQARPSSARPRPPHSPVDPTPTLNPHNHGQRPADRRPVRRQRWRPA
jgi:hypothetical protein